MDGLVCRTKPKLQMALPRLLLYSGLHHFCCLGRRGMGVRCLLLFSNDANGFTAAALSGEFVDADRACFETGLFRYSVPLL
jgi:hypothetical protein